MRYNIWIVTYLIFVFPVKAFAGGIDDYAKCSGVMASGALIQQMNLKYAPPYAKEKYEKKYQFYLQGVVNLKNNARDEKNFNEKKFDKLADYYAKQNMSFLRCNPDQDELEQFNSQIKLCVEMSNLNEEDLE